MNVIELILIIFLLCALLMALWTYFGVRQDIKKIQNNQNQEVSEGVVEGVENLTNINETFVEGIMVDEIHEENPVIVSAYII